MIKDFLASLEDPNRSLLGPNVWIMKKIGILLPDNKVGKAAYLFLHAVTVFFVFTQYVELLVIRSDLELVFTNLRISMLSVVCVVKSNSFLFWQSSWRELIEYVTEADKYERDTRDNVTHNILNKYTKYCRKATYFYWILVVVTVISATCNAPLLSYLSSSNYREELRNGTALFPHVYSSWVPIDKYQSPGTWITLIWHISVASYGAATMGAYDLTVIVIMVFFGGKLEILRVRCQQMFGYGGTGISDEEAFKRIKQLHNMHIQLTKYSRLFNSLLSPVMFLYVVMCSIMLCASAFQLTSATSPTQKILMAEFLVFGIAQLFMFCWHSNIVLIKSQNLIYGLYESEWWAANVRQRKAFHILSGQFRINFIYKAGPFTDLTLPTFITILKGAYSYYTLIRK